MVELNSYDLSMKTNMDKKYFPLFLNVASILNTDIKAIVTG